jgi:succinyl-diaminopimelate desuccinylase
LAVTSTIDPVALTQSLIRCASVTPEDAGVLDTLARALEPLGFVCHRLSFAAPGTRRVDNLYARLGSDDPNFCFGGHTDVVPVGDRAAWSVDPFGGIVRDGALIGRGASDMKGAVAAFVAAAARFLERHGRDFGGSISLLITNDEEGPALNGTKPALEWVRARGERIDACIVGEPTNPKELGEMIKIGRRGSLTGRLTVHGVQGHIAYPMLADNPVHRLLKMLGTAVEEPLDRGNAHFQPSSLQVATVDVGNPASNVIPAQARAVFNIRFNNHHTAASLERRLRRLFDEFKARYELAFDPPSEAFLTPPGPLAELVRRAVAEVTGRDPEYSTTGGTSDARFIKDHCPVVEFGLTGETAHKVDEQARVSDLASLTDIYAAVLDRFFDGPARPA